MANYHRASVSSNSQHPKHKKQTNEDEPIQKLKREFKQRKSPMLQAKSSDKSVIKLAQDLVPKKCGII
jgi:hypothetical protein